jgi:hypothetical protein
VNSELYRSAWLLAGQWRGAYDPTPYVLIGGYIAALPAAGPAVYVACGADNGVAYVGSTVSGTLGRISTHLREPVKAERWRILWVVGLRADTPELAVRRIEGRVGDWLAPVGNRRLPRAWGP